MKKFLLILFLLCFSTNLSIMAQKKRAKNPCDNAQTQLEINICAQQEYEKADAELNRTYKALVAKLEAAHKDKLKAAEMAWIQYRDANCECEAFPYREGSIHPTIYASCLKVMTEARTKELKDYLKELEE